RRLNGFLMVVEADKLRLRECLGHKDRGGALTAAHVSHLSAFAELLPHAVKRGDPGRDQVRGVAGTEKLLAAMKHIAVVFAPSHAGTAAKRLDDARDVPQGSQCQLKRSRQIRGTVLIRKRNGPFGSQAEFAGRDVIIYVAARGLGAEPFAHIARVSFGTRRQLVSARRAGGE